MTAPTKATAREAVELPKPYDEWTAYAKRAGLLDENGVAPQDGRMNTQTAYYAYSAAWNRLYPLLAAKQEEVDKMTGQLQFVERWANHHGQKPHTTPQEALSIIQHYPPILAITRSYVDGKFPETRNPYAELERMREALKEILKRPWPVTNGVSDFQAFRANEMFIAELKQLACAALSPIQGADHE